MIDQTTLTNGLTALSSAVRVSKDNLKTSSSHSQARSVSYEALLKGAKAGNEGTVKLLANMFIRRISAARQTASQFNRSSGEASRARWLANSYSRLLNQLYKNHQHPEQASWIDFEPHGLSTTKLSLWDKMILINRGNVVGSRGENCGILYPNQDGYRLLLGEEEYQFDTPDIFAIVCSAPEEEVPFDDCGVFPTSNETVNLNGRSVVVKVATTNPATGERYPRTIRISMAWRTYLCLVCACGLKRFEREARLLEAFFGDRSHIPANECEVSGFWKFRYLDGRSPREIEAAQKPSGMLDGIPLASLTTSAEWHAFYTSPSQVERRARLRAARRGEEEVAASLLQIAATDEEEEDEL